MPKLAPGLYDLPITVELQRALEDLGRQRLDSAQDDPDSGDSHDLLGRHLATIVRQILLSIPKEERLQRQAEICNELIRVLAATPPADAVAFDGERLIVPARRLAAVYPTDGPRQEIPSAPDIPLSQSDLLIQTRGEPGIGHILGTEIDSADRIDAIVAFIRWSGLRLLEPKLKEFLASGRTMRVITTTYTGSTERRAIEHLVQLGAQVKVSYHTDSTRLHAKSWLFHRASGFSTAFIGSSNLSTSAMRDGLEWNVRLAQADAPSILEKFAATFESYWQDPDFELYDPAQHAERFDQAVAGARREEPLPITLFDLRPWPHQREILEKLRVERFRHQRWKNLVVAATGTGKTVIAGFDYEQLREELGRDLTLLFVAHRKEILSQSLYSFRSILKDGSFGELYVDGAKPEQWRHVFASIQSLANYDLGTIRPDFFDVVIVDEFHHAAAPTYRKLLAHLTPKVLLGLTATPERTDGQSVLEWFDGRFAAELRLWDALERGLLSPFHYFGVHDSIDLSSVRWVRGSYDIGELENLYTGNDARVRQIVAALDEKVTDRRSMRALGFCVGVSHARYMAQRFNDAGIPSRVVVGDTSSEERDAALRELKDGAINALFAVDIFNEGVDVPQIDTVLMLRPTESPTIFLQQLGRGLRHAKGKECLTVLDFIGNAHRNFRFDLRYRALTGATRREIEEQVDRGFPYLPAGCSIQLDREASRIVLANLKQAIGNRFASLVAELRPMGRDTTLARFLHDARLDPEDLYRTRGWSWTRLKREAFGDRVFGNDADVATDRRAAQRAAAPPSSVDTRPIEERPGRPGEETGPIDLVAEGKEQDPRATAPSPRLRGEGPGAERSEAEGGEGPNESALLNSLTRLLHIDDEERLTFYRTILSRPRPPDSLSTREHRMLESLLLTFFEGKERDRNTATQALWNEPDVRAELLELLDVLDDRADHRTYPIQTERLTAGPELLADVPLAVHARYSRDEVLAALGRLALDTGFSQREGTLWDPATNSDWFFITLEKSEKHYSPTTRYRDYAISPDLFHWESQSTTTESSPTGQRYIDHAARGSNVMLLVRESNKRDGRTMPFTLLGSATYVRHAGEKPMGIVWHLHRAMPDDLFKVARVAAG